MLKFVAFSVAIGCIAAVIGLAIHSSSNPTSQPASATPQHREHADRGASSCPSISWKKDPVFTQEWSASIQTRADIDILDTVPSLDTFLRKYQYKKPFLVRSFYHCDGSMKDLLMKDAFLARYGNFRISVGTQHELASGGAGSETMPLKSYVHRLASVQPGGPLLTFFDRGQFLRRAKKLAKEFRLPDVRQEAWAQEGRSSMSSEKIFSIGSSGSGLSFHVHNDAWNVLLVGQKRWGLFPPNGLASAGFDSAVSFLTWLKTVYPHVPSQERPIEFIQQPGDLVYVPEGFYHATLNMGETIVYASQDKEPSVEGFMHLYNKAVRLRSEDPRQAAEAIEAALTLMPRNPDGWNQKGFVYYSLYEKSGDPRHKKEAESALRRAIALNPLLGAAYQNLVILLRESGRYQESDGLLSQARDLRIQHPVVASLQSSTRQ